MPKELTVAAAMARMPEGHYDGKFIAPFILESKSPNKHAAAGYMIDRRFFAEDFGQALAEALGDGWTLKPYNDSGFNYTTESAMLIKGETRITIRCKGWGAGAYQHLSFSSWVTGPENRSVSGPEIKVAASKDVATIARDVTRRILPALNATELLASEAKAKVKAEREALEAKLAKLQRAYPDLKFAIRQDSKEITASTKYGSKIEISGGRIYHSTGEGAWRFVCGTGHGMISIDDLDAPHGRAFLKLIND